MSLAPFALVILASFLHAAWNLLAKRAAAAGSVFVLANSLVSCLAYAPWLVWSLRHGTTAWSAPALACLLGSGALHLGYSLCLQRGYQVADLSVVYPVARGTGPALSCLAAFLLLGETATPEGLVGLALVIVGIGLITAAGDLSVFRRPAGHAGLFWGTTTGTLIAGYTVVDAVAVKHFGMPPVAMNWSSNFLSFAPLVPLAISDREGAAVRMRGRWGLALAVGLLSPLAYILVLTALGMGAPLSAVAPAREMSMMIGALLGMAVLREPVGTWRLGGCAVLAIGVVLLGRG